MTKRMAGLVPEDDPGFLTFWSLFPRREAKKDARKAWAQLNPSSELVERIRQALEWQVPANQWDTANREFCPLPATYLRGERFNDERRNVARELKADIRGHVPPCKTYQDCIDRALREG